MEPKLVLTDTQREIEALQEKIVRTIASNPSVRLSHSGEGDRGYEFYIERDGGSTTLWLGAIVNVEHLTPEQEFSVHFAPISAKFNDGSEVRVAGAAWSIGGYVVDETPTGGTEFGEEEAIVHAKKILRDLTND